MLIFTNLFLSSHESFKDVYIFSIVIYVWIYENRVEDCTKIAGMFLENRSDSVQEYGHVMLY